MSVLCFRPSTVYIGWFSPDPPVSSTNKTDRHGITEILLKLALNTIKQTVYMYLVIMTLK